MSSISSFEGRATPEPDEINYENNENKIWDPGGNRGAPNKQLLQRILVSSSEAMDEDATDNLSESRTELDTHANMCVFGKHCFIL